jgi:SAM-dependent methyltransferase
MSPPPGETEYRGLKAAAWDAIRGDTSAWPDRAFYLQLIQERGGPVLDVGCGTGRLLLDYAALGYRVDGVDDSPAMLERCRAKAATAGLAVEIFEQSIESLDLSRRYRFVIVPSATIQLLWERERVAVAMERLVAHLEPGGTLVASFMVPEPRFPEWSDWAPTSRRVDWGGGRILRRYSRAWHDETERLEHLEERYEVKDAAGETLEAENNLRSPAMRWYDIDAALALLASAGLRSGRALTMANTPAGPADAVFCVAGELE